MSTNVKKTRMKSRCIGLGLSIVFVIVVAFAFLIATEKKSNVFTVGKVHISLCEDYWEAEEIVTNNKGEPETLYDGSIVHRAINNEFYEEYGEVMTDKNGRNLHAKLNIVPGEIIKKDPLIKNDGDNNAYVYVSLTVPKINNVELYEYTITDHWHLIKSDVTAEKDYVLPDGENIYYFYYDEILKPNTSTEPLFQNNIIRVTNDSSFNYQGFTRADIVLNGYACQTNFEDRLFTVFEAWNTICDIRDGLPAISIQGE